VATPYLDELVRRLRLVHPGRRGRGRGEGATIGWRDDRLGHPLLLFVGERDLAAAVTSLGEDCRDLLWPDSTIGETGVNLLLVHVEEVVATRHTTAPLRITPAGPEWLEDR